MQDLRAIQGGGHSDLELIERYKKTHNNEILGVLYERYMHLVYGTCLKYLKDQEAAKDAVMNIFEELMTKLRTHQVDNFRSWLFVVSKNHCLMQLRKESRTQTTEIPVSLMQSEEEIHLNGVMEKEKHLNDLEDCQGHAHALNLHDSGVEVERRAQARQLVTCEQAEEAGLEAVGARRGGRTRRADRVAPPPRPGAAAECYAARWRRTSTTGSAILFAHGFNVHYGRVAPPAG